jgi:hypothetical protein
LVEVDCLTAIQFRTEPGIILTRRFEEAASLQLTRGSSWIWKSRKAAVPAKVQPHGLLQPGQRCVETSGDVIENDLISTPESRLLDFSPRRLGAAKNGKLAPSDFNSLVRDSPKRFRFLNPEQFGTILP